jgi:hypothetical protein
MSAAPKRPDRDAVSAFVVAGWSGFYVMLVELLSSRLLAPFFGSSIYVWGSIIFVFMLGLAIGYLLGGLYSRRDASLRRLAALQALSALATLPTLFWGEAVAGWLFDTGIDVRTASLAACVALFFIPTVFAGMVSPYAVRIIIKDRASSGRDAGYLYFVSTLGSSAGTLLTSFFFVLWWEVNAILAGGIGVSVAVCAIAALTAGKAAAKVQHPEEAAS